MPSDSSPSLFGPQDFSLVIGGPLYQLLRRARLSGDALSLVRQRIVVISLLVWVPLLVLSVLEGQALGGTAVPFLFDVDVHVRFLVAMPLLIAAELVVHQRMRKVAQVFLDRHLVADADRPRFDAAVAATIRLRNSVLAEVLLIGLVYGVGILVVWRQYTALDTSTWYAIASDAGGSKNSLAGLWYGYVSLPIFQFLLIRWYFRIAIWIRFLWQMSRIELRLVPTHPDRVGGLGFLSGTAYAFSLLGVAHGALLAGQIANRIFFLGAALPDFLLHVAFTVGFLLVLVLGPLLMFAPQLSRARQVGLREYGTLAEEYVRAFDGKWLREPRAPGEPLIGSADLQSLADLGNSFEVIRTMRLAPVTKETVMQLAMFTLVPLAPLGLTMMPLDQLLKAFLGVLF